jgi:diguanylate cyclase (GGDEF)-like protein/PAS domain S-box-containing protein
MSLFFLASILIRSTGLCYAVVMMRRLRDWRLGFLAVVLGAVDFYELYLLFVFNLSKPFSITGPDTDLYWMIESILTFLAVLFVIRIITERRDVEERLEAKEQEYKSLYDQNPDAVYTLDLTGRILNSNPACLAVLGYAAGDIKGGRITHLIRDEDMDRTVHLFEQAVAGEPQNYEIGIHHKNGQAVQLNVTNVPIVVNGKVVGVYGIAKDITERKDAEQRIRHMAFYDTLTNLPNRVLFEERLRMELSQMQKIERQLAVMFLDLDRFKFINDTLGHAVGDRLLQGVTQRLLSIVETCDTVSRISGDEFAIILPDRAGAQEAGQLAQQILAGFTQPLMVDGIELFTTASIGISVYPDDGTDSATLIKNADMAMYRAKELGRNNYQMYTLSMNAHSEERLSLESDLRKALDRDEFVVYYQPQINVHTGELIGVEALVRWNHPKRGMISPGDFIPLAEETGLIVPIGEWVLRTACAQVKAWKESGFPQLRVAVNLSARQFLREDLVEVVARALHDTELAPQYLDLEITESMTMHNVDRAIMILHGLKNLGVHISLDDFGTGYSSLSYLKHFPIHMLKIDQSFVRDITTDPDDAAIASSIIALAHTLNLHVIAEGVETEEQLAYLTGHGCHEMQGYLFSPPVPVAKFEDLLHFFYRTESNGLVRP